MSSGLLSDRSVTDESDRVPVAQAMLRGLARFMKSRYGGPVGAVALGVVAVVVWKQISGSLVDPLFISEPKEVWAALIDMFRSGDLRAALPTTVYEAVVGFLWGSIPAAILGMFLGRVQAVAAVVRPYIVALYSSPHIALAPLYIIWFGIGTPMKIWFTATVVFFYVFFSAYSGATDVSADMINSMRLMKAGRLFVFRHVVLPSTMAWIIAGLRLAVPHAFTAAIVGEIIASNRGLGFLLSQASGQFDTAKVFAILVVIVTMALLGTALLTVVERRLLRWRQAAGSSFGQAR